jgi:hypothetical protein
VYHVYPFSESFFTFLWDFGGLDPENEKEIIVKMVTGMFAEFWKNGTMQNFKQTLVDTIVCCQKFCRGQLEGSEVSLRDVNRFLTIFKHFVQEEYWQKSN